MKESVGVMKQLLDKFLAERHRAQVFYFHIKSEFSFRVKFEAKFEGGLIRETFAALWGRRTLDPLTAQRYFLGLKQIPRS